MAQTTPSSSALAVQDFFSTTLSSGCTASDTTIYLTTLPTGTEGYLLLDAGNTSTQELIFYNAKGANYVTVPSTGDRGIGGTTAQSHSSGAVVKQTINSDYWNSIKNGSALTYLKNGWIPGTGTWTYASATTFTVPAADAALMSVGTKIWLTQTTSKYFYVTGVSGTTITVTGGSDYTVANAAITAPYFSNAETPVGFPQGFNFTMAISAAGGSPAIGNGTSVGKFILRGKLCTVTNFKLTVGSSTNMGTGAFYLGYPITPSAAQYAANVTIGTCYLEDAGVNGYLGLVRAAVGISAYFTMICHAIAANGRALDISGGSGVPFSFGTSDFITGNYTYEVA